MTKIIHVISDSNIGGAGKYLLNYLENCDRERFNVKVVLPFKSLLIDEISNLGFEYKEIDGLAEMSYSRIAVRELKKIFKEEKPDIVHAHGCFSARIAAKKCHIKIVYTRHTDAAVSKKLSNPVGKLINGWVNNYFADGIIAVSKSARENLLNTGVSGKKIRVIYNGVAPARKMNEEEKKAAYDFFGINYGTKIVSIVARLEEFKGHKYFIDAAKIVGDNNYDVKFLIAGTGSREAFLRNYAKEKGADNVVFLGFVKNVSDLNNITYIQVNASLYEAFGLAVVEGMRLGVPAVVSGYGGNKEVVVNEETGFIINGQNSEEFAEKIMLLLDDTQLYEKMSHNSSNRFNECFTASVMTRNIEKFYEDLLGGKINENQI